ncbi:hypothetical protein P20495_1415 [Pseudoalteromonas sp. BSi20495]|nr:hypothetical protein P20495_1415 [Pseudoalteromonas sp. BSi20495]
MVISKAWFCVNELDAVNVGNVSELLEYYLLGLYVGYYLK